MTNKTFGDRIRITRNGKLLSRAKGQDHFNAKEGGRRQLAKGRSVQVAFKKKTISRYL